MRIIVEKNNKSQKKETTGKRYKLSIIGILILGATLIYGIYSGDTTAITVCAGGITTIVATFVGSDGYRPSGQYSGAPITINQGGTEQGGTTFNSGKDEFEPPAYTPSN